MLCSLHRTDAEDRGQHAHPHVLMRTYSDADTQQRSREPTVPTDTRPHSAASRHSSLTRSQHAPLSADISMEEIACEDEVNTPGN